MGDRGADPRPGLQTNRTAALGRRRPSDSVNDPGPAQPTLSICVPTFNRPILVQEAIRSIVQSAPASNGEVEIIVSDNSPAISEEACRLALDAWGGRSLYIGNDRNIGMTANLNQCIARASGRHLIFVCDDDQLLPGAVPKILRAVATSRESDKVLLFGVEAVDEAGRVLRRHAFASEARLGPRDAVYRLLTGFGFVWFPGVVVGHDAYAAAGPFDAEIGNATDVEMWLRLLSRHGVRCLPDTISAYSVHPQSATQSMALDAEAIARTMTIFERARTTGVLPGRTIARSQARYFHQLIISAAYLHLRSGDVTGAREEMALFGLPSVRTLGPSLTWLPLRLVFAVLVRSPSGLVRPLMKALDRLDLVRRIRALQSLGRVRLA